MNAECYEEIFSTQMLPSASELLGHHYVFQHDNDPNHTAKWIVAFLKRKCVQVLEWPPQSPDLNVIEHLWDDMECRCRDELPRNKDELKDMLCRVWDNTEQSVCSKLVEIIPRWLQAVIDAKGGPTSY